MFTPNKQNTEKKSTYWGNDLPFVIDFDGIKINRDEFNKSSKIDWFQKMLIVVPENHWDSIPATFLSLDWLIKLRLIY